MERIEERFLRYVAVDTESAEEVEQVPSTERQHDLARMLCRELQEMGFEAEHDEHCYVYGTIPGNRPDAPVIGFIAHMDTSPDMSGKDVKAKIVRFTGEDILLNAEKGIVLSVKDYPSLEKYRGEDIICTDGTTLLGADDKAGVAEIMTLAQFYAENPDVPHGTIKIGFTPDEEVGNGPKYFDVKKFGADFAYTVDGGELGEIEYENFNAANAGVFVRGVNIHPGSAKNKMKNALLIALEYAGLLPPAETPAHTEGYEGFYHLHDMKGNETEAELHYLIRDHDRAKFEARKQFLAQAAAFLNQKYGAGTVEVVVKDSYYNMKEQIEPHMYLILRARAAMEAAGITPVEVPIRGGTDGARLSYMGLPCPNLCTGGVNFHGVHEYIPAAALNQMAQVLVNLVTA